MTVRAIVPAGFTATQADVDAGLLNNLRGQVTIVDASGVDTGKRYNAHGGNAAPVEAVDSGNINTVLSAAGGAGWEKAQAIAANYVIVRPASGASLDLHIEVGGTLAAMLVANWPIPASGVDQLRIRNKSAIAQTFSATGYSGVTTADGNAATSGTYSIPVDMDVHITIDEDGWIQVAPMGQEVSQSEMDAALALKASAKAPVASYSASATYAVGDQAIQNNILYKCKTAITVAEAFTVAKWDVVGSADPVLKTVDGQSLIGPGNIAPTILLVAAPIAIRIAGAAGAGTNYQTKITIGESGGATGANFNLSAAAATFPAGKNGTCSFLFWDSAGAVPFWVEKVTGTTPNRVAHVWLRPNIDLSSGTQTVFLTTAATNLVRSSGDGVFTLFDDFDGAAVDATKWDTAVLSGQTLASSVLSFGGGNVARRLLTLDTIGDGVEIMALLRASDTSASTSNFGFVETGNTATTFNYRNVWDSNSAVMVGNTANTLTNNVNNGAGVRQVMRIGRSGGAGRFTSENPVNTFTAASGVPTAVTKSTIYNTYDNSTEIDWVATKKFAATEPAFASAVQ